MTMDVPIASVYPPFPHVSHFPIWPFARLSEQHCETKRKLHVGLILAIPAITMKLAGAQTNQKEKPEDWCALMSLKVSRAK